jgi:V8-like Glu-specific endopeptidase
VQPSVAEGQVLAGNYRVERVLLQGGMALAFGILTFGCSDTERGADRPVSQPILNGVPAPEESAVVAVINFAGGSCSGAVIAPRLVLTARHCIAETEGEELEVRCGETKFVAPDSPGAIFVVTLPEVSDDPDDYAAVSTIRVPEADPELCGHDVALLVTERPLAGITPLEPRIDPEATAGERFSSIGYGRDDAIGGPYGIRRRRDDLEVACVGASCADTGVRDREWLGSAGPCQGDSGGPALDADGRVIGVVSRGEQGCQGSIFGSVAARGAWLAAEARRAAMRPEDAPVWACPKGGCSAAEDDTEASCSISTSRSPGGWCLVLLVLGILGAALGRRTRRNRTAWRYRTMF